LRCSISALVAQPLKATSSARTAGHRVRMSELKSVADSAVKYRQS
jgi:hypothetical protein